jgi:hypothetical protein
MDAVQNIATFNTPILAQRLDTQPGAPMQYSRLLATGCVGDGSQQGRNNLYLSVNEQGQSKWEPIEQFKIIDASVLPDAAIVAANNVTTSTRTAPQSR